MAPSAKHRALMKQSRSDRAIFRVTKSSKLNIQTSVSKQKLDAIEEVVQEKTSPAPQTQKPSSASKKRRHDTVESDVENEEVATRPRKFIKQRRSKITIPTPPASSPEPEILPAIIEELQTLHKCFVQALAVHCAHNGMRNAVSLSAVMPAMTRLWKRRAVVLLDIQRILAIWETPVQGIREVEHNKGPFKLVTTGIGSSQQTKVEYVWAEKSGTFIENEMIRKYAIAVEELFQKAQTEPQSYAYVHEPVVHFPSLKCQIGTQTQARQGKISSIRDQILSKPAKTVSAASEAGQSEPDFSKLNISDPNDASVPPTSREDKLKSRTLGLFDRLRAKKLANSTSASPPSSADMLRLRALHRIPEIIDLLRHKQSQKLNSLFRSDLHGSPTGTRTVKMKVSFGLQQLVQDIRDSGRVPIAEEEIKEGILILGQELPDPWCSVYCGTEVKCVTLQGEGWRKQEVKEWCDEEINRMKSK